MLPEVLPYHLRVRDHFKKLTSVWEFFAATRNDGELQDELEVTDRIITAIAGRADSDPAYTETARLYRLYKEIDAPGPAIMEMVEGPIDLDRLDLLTQAALHALTRDMVLELLQPEWTRTAALMDLAHRYFPDLSWPEEFDPGGAGRLAATLAGAQSNVHEYFAWVLLDFVRADPPLEDRLLERALAFAEATGLLAVFHKIQSE